MGQTNTRVSFRKIQLEKERDQPELGWQLRILALALLVRCLDDLLA